MTPAEIVGNSPLDAWLRFIAIMVGIIYGGYQARSGRRSLEPKHPGKHASVVEHRLDDVIKALDKVDRKLDGHIRDHALNSYGGRR